MCLVAITYLQTYSTFAKLKTESRLPQSPIILKDHQDQSFTSKGGHLAIGLVCTEGAGIVV